MGNETDFTTNQDVTKSVGQLCEQLSITNLSVPKIDTCRDVFEFIQEFEMVTESLPENQRSKMLAKAFPPGRYRAWYEVELKPSIQASSDWNTIKSKIIKRYSKVEDRDRHFKRLQSMKFNPNGSLELFDYVEDLLYSLSKAWPNEKDETSKIRYVKANLPSSILPTLSSIPEFKSAKTLEDFKEAIKQYDILKEGFGESSENSGEKINTSELVTLLKDLAKGISKQEDVMRAQGESIAKNIVAALQPIQGSSYRQDYRNSNEASQMNSRRASPYRSSDPRAAPLAQGEQYYRRGSPSPNRRGYTSHNYNRDQTHQQDPHYNRSQSNYRSTNYQTNKQYQRSPTPPRRVTYSDQNYMQKSGGNNDNPIRNKLPMPINVEEYYKKNDYPPSPCSNCGLMHWIRHCQQLNNLN